MAERAQDYCSDMLHLKFQQTHLYTARSVYEHKYDLHHYQKYEQRKILVEQLKFKVFCGYKMPLGYLKGQFIYFFLLCF